MPALLILFFICMILFAPCLLIWSLNTLFGLHIAYGVAEYFAALIVLWMTGNFKFNSKKD
jgi:hypothetical protein